MSAPIAWHAPPWGRSFVDPGAVRLIDPDDITCCIRGCGRQLARAHRGEGRWNPKCFCEVHGIRVSSSPTYVYRREEAFRNFILERDLAMKFASVKTERWRLGNETSEDALTWNAVVGLARLGRLRELAKALSGARVDQEPALYLWGHRLDGQGPTTWSALERARQEFEDDLSIQTEPDFALHVPGRLLVIVEAKFGSANSTLDKKDAYESVEDFLGRYGSGRRGGEPLDRDWILAQPSERVLEQLCRMAVFANHLRAEGEEAVVVNLLRSKEAKAAPPAFDQHLRSEGPVRFALRTWEELAALAEGPEAAPLRAYLHDKTYRLRPAFDLPTESP